MSSVKTYIRFGVPLLFLATSLSAAIVGTNVPSQAITAESITALPASQQSIWQAYLQRSEKQLQADHAAFRAEMRAHHLTNLVSAPSGRTTKELSKSQSASWYTEPEALRLAGILVSFQTPAGGWSKNLDLTQHPRQPGELYAQANVSKYNNPTDLDYPHDPAWNYVGTFDNDATITQLRFLAKVVSAVDKKRGEVYRKSFLRGLDYIFAAQFPNGGWPQVWPLQGGYHDAVTFNDGAMTGILDLLDDITDGESDFGFVPARVRQQAAASLQHGIQCVLATQIIANGKRTAWCQQYDPLTLQPCSARNYEMPSISSGESTGLMQFLMRVKKPDANIVAALDASAAWFGEVAIHDEAFKKVGEDGRHLVASPGSGPLWSRYYDIHTNRPIFGDRDKSIHDTINEISKERRDGYSWFSERPKTTLEKYAQWKKRL